MKIRSLCMALLMVLVVGVGPLRAAHAEQLPADVMPGRSQASILFADGTMLNTGNSAESRPSLSLSKLYLGEWILHHGAAADRDAVYPMIKYSDDGMATRLDRKYPRAIPETIAKYGLSQTRYPGYWGYTSTSTQDVVRFLARARQDATNAPLMNGMRDAAPIAADGYPQNYGTSHLPGVEGTKFGWSDNRQINATASIGNGFVVAVNTYGSAVLNTQDALTLRPYLERGSQGAAPALPVPEVPALPEVLERPGVIDLPQLIEVPFTEAPAAPPTFKLPDVLSELRPPREDAPNLLEPLRELTEVPFFPTGAV